jgi:hypothetical protein
MKTFMGLCAVAVATLAPSTQAQTKSNSYGMTNRIEVRVNSRLVAFPDERPVVRDGRILLPLRAVLAALPGMALVWDPAELTVSGAYLDRSVRLKIGSRFAKVNGRNTEMDVPATTMGGRTMVPLRFVGEALGAVVTWNDADRRVSLSVPVLNVPGSVATATPRRFFRTETPIISSSRPRSGAQSQPKMSDAELLAALEEQLKLGYGLWTENRAVWARANNEYMLWANLQVTFNSMTFYNGSSGLTGGPTSALIPNNPVGWARWQATLAELAARDAYLQQQLGQTYAAYLQLFRRINPNGTPLALPGSP